MVGEVAWPDEEEEQPVLIGGVRQPEEELALIYIIEPEKLVVESATMDVDPEEMFAEQAEVDDEQAEPGLGKTGRRS